MSEEAGADVRYTINRYTYIRTYFVRYQGNCAFSLAKFRASELIVKPTL